MKSLGPITSESSSKLKMMVQWHSVRYLGNRFHKSQQPVTHHLFAISSEFLLLDSRTSGHETHSTCIQTDRSATQGSCLPYNIHVLQWNQLIITIVLDPTAYIYQDGIAHICYFFTLRFLLRCHCVHIFLSLLKTSISLKRTFCQYATCSTARNIPRSVEAGGKVLATFDQQSRNS